MGRTEILATVSIEDKAAPHMRGLKEGWLTAEYAMLPRATTDRQPRERSLQNGRRHEIQRLLGRAMRASMDLRPFRNQTLYMDCDVLVADGGTRVASILAAHAALHDFCDRLMQRRHPQRVAHPASGRGHQRGLRGRGTARGPRLRRGQGGAGRPERGRHRHRADHRGAGRRGGGTDAPSPNTSPCSTPAPWPCRTSCATWAGSWRSFRASSLGAGPPAASAALRPGRCAKLPHTLKPGISKEVSP